MADLYSPKKTETVTTAGPTAFWPFVLLALSLCAVLVWQLIVATQARQHGAQLRDQQVKLVEQSRRVQQGLQKFARDLVEVAKTDEEAKAIVTKAGISVTNQSGSPAAAAPVQPSPSGQ
jgi:cytoskeletal protein RodZ